MIDARYIKNKEVLLSRTSLTDTDMLRLETCFNDKQGRQDLNDILKELLKQDDLSFVTEDFIDKLIDARMKELAKQTNEQIILQDAVRLDKENIVRVSNKESWKLINIILNYLIVAITYAAVTIGCALYYPKVNNPYYYLLGYVIVSVIFFTLTYIKANKQFKLFKKELQESRDEIRKGE